MRNTKNMIVTLALLLLPCVLVAATKGIPGYVLTSGQGPTTNLLKEIPKSATYNDQDIKQLVLHNLGILNYKSNVTDSAQDLISEYGSRNLIKQNKLNYMFLLEGESSHLFEREGKVLSKSNLKHQTSLFEICNSSESKECILSHLFNDKDEASVINKLKAVSNQENPEAYFYSTSNTASSFPKATLTTLFGHKGAVYIMDQNSKEFKISDSLNSCVNNILKGEYVVDFEKGTISAEKKFTKIDESPVLAINENAKQDFLQFMTDVCSVVGISTLIRRDSNPSFFVFHLNSLHKLESQLSGDDNAVLSKVFNIAYEKLVKNLLYHYKPEEVSGQILILSPENNLNTSGNKNEILLELEEDHFKSSKRVLAEQTSTTTSQGTSSTTTIIFQSILIAFVLVIAWVCIEMFNMEIQQDSVVYAKFLAADYFRR